MKTSLYQALGISRNASLPQIKAALRGLVRDYHRGDLGGDADAALRFINHAYGVLTNADKRAEYDASLVAAEETAAASPAAKIIEAPPAPVSKPLQPAAEPTRNQRREPALARIPVDRLTEPGATRAFHAAARLFQETRGRAEARPLPFFSAARRPLDVRTSAEKPWPRLIARLMDYGIWGLIAAALLRTLASRDAIPAEHIHGLMQPLAASIAIPLSWLPVEILLLHFFRTTPGKWLTNIRVRFSASDPFAPDAPGSRLFEVARRSFRVWLRGVGCGIPLVNLLAMDNARRQLIKRHETSWDFDGDCLITHGKLGLVEGGSAVLLALLLLSAYGFAWLAPLKETGAFLSENAAKTSTWVSDEIEALVDNRKTPPASAPALVALPKITPQAETDGAKWIAEAQRLTGRRDWKNLVHHCRQWSSAEPKNAQAWSCLGAGHNGLGEYAKAVDALKKAAQLAPGDQRIQKSLKASFRAQYRQSGARETSPAIDR